MAACNVTARNKGPVAGLPAAGARSTPQCGIDSSMCARWQWAQRNISARHTSPPSISLLAHFPSRGWRTTAGALVVPMSREPTASRSWVEVIRYQKADEGPKSRYGFWFFPARGSGVYLYTGLTWQAHSKKWLLSLSNPKSLSLPFSEALEPRERTRLNASYQELMRDRSLLAKKLKATASNHGNPNSVRDFHTHSFSEVGNYSAEIAASVVALRSVVGTNGGNEIFPFLAYKLGIDTVQVESNRQFGAEIIMTSRQSMEAPHLNGSGGGPGLSPTCIRGLRAGWNASRPCHCDLDVPTLTCLL